MTQKFFWPEFEADRTFRPNIGRFPAICDRFLNFEISKIPEISTFLSKKSTFFFSKLSFALKSVEKYSKWFGGLSLDPKDDFHAFYDHI